jgi:hypothetical protein
VFVAVIHYFLILGHAELEDEAAVSEGVQFHLAAESIEQPVVVLRVDVVGEGAAWKLVELDVGGFLG